VVRADRKRVAVARTSRNACTTRGFLDFCAAFGVSPMIEYTFVL